jgi:hypothetical protein
MCVWEMLPGQPSQIAVVGAKRQASVIEFRAAAHTRGEAAFLENGLTRHSGDSSILPIIPPGPHRAEQWGDTCSHISPGLSFC